MNSSPSPQRLTLLKVGGNLVEHSQRLVSALDAFQQCEGPKVLVHGGGRSATQLAEQLGVDAPLVDGRRITNADMLKIAVMMYGGWVNKSLVASLQQRGVNAIGLTGADLSVIKAHKRRVGEIDYGFVGDIDVVDAKQLEALLHQGIVPVLAPITHDTQGQLLNTNADTIAASTAIALSPFYEVHLVYAFELPGVLTEPNNMESVIPQITPPQFEELAAQGIISGGMIPKLSNAFEALRQGVHQVYICKADQVKYLGSSEYLGTVLTTHSST